MNQRISASVGNSGFTTYFKQVAQRFRLATNNERLQAAYCHRPSAVLIDVDLRGRCVAMRIKSQAKVVNMGNSPESVCHG